MGASAMTAEALVLVVEGDEYLSSVRCNLLQKAGYKTIQAATGMDGLRSVDEFNPDLVLLDAVLPDSDGIEVCCKIKTNSKDSKSYVVLLWSVKTYSESEAWDSENGADGDRRYDYRC